MKHYLFATSLMVALYFAPSCEVPRPIAGGVEITRDTTYFDLTIENIYREILRNEIKFPEIVLAQVKLETGHLTSKNCHERNNLFGMKGGVHSDSNPNGYMIYKHWFWSIRAYKKWQRHAYGDSDEDYYQFLERIGYAESQTYISNLKSIIAL